MNPIAEYVKKAEKRQGLRRKNVASQKSSAEKMIANIISLKPDYRELCESSLLSQHLKERFSELIEKRCSVLVQSAPENVIRE
ncbi:MAG: hypothetical protein IJU01_03340 [Lachnospiraceae bacterium]|nr:hypothetical protein [Lachnospiraceae bacterium]